MEETLEELKERAMRLEATNKDLHSRLTQAQLGEKKAIGSCLEMERKLWDGVRARAKFMDGLRDSGTDVEVIKASLAIADEGTGWWRAVNKLLLIEIEKDVDGAIVPDLVNDLRQYRAGRAAALKDFQSILQQVWQAGRVENREAGKK